jgi:glutaredoxin
VSTEREARVRAAMRRVPVTLYMEQWCGASQKARAWLRANDIDYREIDLTASPAAEPEFKRLSPQGTIPVLDIDGTVLVGFRPDAVEAALRRVAAAKVRE